MAIAMRGKARQGIGGTDAAHPSIPQARERRAGPVRFYTNVRVYQDHPAVAFEQPFPLGTAGAADTGGDQDRVISSFPAFAVGGDDTFWADKGFLTYAHNM